MRPELTLRRLQAEIADWSRRNFPGKEPLDPFLGVVEEVGELGHALLKRKQGIRGTAAEHDAAIKDAVADVVIFLADFCEQNNICLQEVVEDTWWQVKQRDWQANKETGVANG